MAQRQAPAGFDDLPPSAKYIHMMLTYEGALSYTEIVEETDLPQSTVSDGLESLQEHDLINERLGDDARSRRYTVESEH